ncbi:uncharacterized protein CLUP02_16192 [Colletotrichum lupini]|uniref:Uncharacterized protein n=1 Tax=Colletotrichum lupini TaxID=145971 RepID=A0A9Q8T9F7_9PEZI|nr:uncharacterized protein CLUP02_16192 [Colletotrichum lupini]UQC90662.1 hypothetical protein CLUP02_16192 [Colletotrichum lupini]
MQQYHCRPRPDRFAERCIAYLAVQHRTITSDDVTAIRDRRIGQYKQNSTHVIKSLRECSWMISIFNGGPVGVTVGGSFLEVPSIYTPSRCLKGSIRDKGVILSPGLFWSEGQLSIPPPLLLLDGPKPRAAPSSAALTAGAWMGAGRRPAWSSERKGTRRERGEARCFSYSKVPFAYGLTPVRIHILSPGRSEERGKQAHGHGADGASLSEAEEKSKDVYCVLRGFVKRVWWDECDIGRWQPGEAQTQGRRNDAPSDMMNMNMTFTSRFQCVCLYFISITYIDWVVALSFLSWKIGKMGGGAAGEWEKPELAPDPSATSVPAHRVHSEYNQEPPVGGRLTFGASALWHLKSAMFSKRGNSKSQLNFLLDFSREFRCTQTHCLFLVPQQSPFTTSVFRSFRMNVFPEAHASDKKKEENVDSAGMVLSFDLVERSQQLVLIAAYRESPETIVSDTPCPQAPRYLHRSPYHCICNSIAPAQHPTCSHVPSFFIVLHSGFSIPLLLDPAPIPQSPSIAMTNSTYKDTLKRAQGSTSKLSGLIDNRDRQPKLSKEPVIMTRPSVPKFSLISRISRKQPQHGQAYLYPPSISALIGVQNRGDSRRDFVVHRQKGKIPLLACRCQRRGPTEEMAGWNIACKYHHMIAEACMRLANLAYDWFVSFLCRNLLDLETGLWTYPKRSSMPPESRERFQIRPIHESPPKGLPDILPPDPSVYRTRPSACGAFVNNTSHYDLPFPHPQPHPSQSIITYCGQYAKSHNAGNPHCQEGPRNPRLVCSQLACHCPPSHHITPPHEELLKTILRPGAQSSRPKLAWRSLITARAVRRHSQTSTESESCPLSPSLIRTKAQIQLSYLSPALEIVVFLAGFTGRSLPPSAHGGDATSVES